MKLGSLNFTFRFRLGLIYRGNPSSLKFEMATSDSQKNFWAKRLDRLEENL
jgi:hypothetical protein